MKIFRKPVISTLEISLISILVRSASLIKVKMRLFVLN